MTTTALSAETLVARHVDMVYAAALRQVRDPHSADDVTQAVLLVLIQKREELRGEEMIGPWLIKVTRYTALTSMRSARRRAHHERAGAREGEVDSAEGEDARLMGMLDEALMALAEPDRRLIVLRYLQGRPVEEIAGALRVRSNTAAKRLQRAMERLRKYFARRGVTASAAVLTAALGAEALRAAPAAVASAVVRAAGANAGGAVSSSGLTTFKGAATIMATSKVKAGMVFAVMTLLFAGGGTAVWMTWGRGSVGSSATTEATTGASNGEIAVDAVPAPIPAAPDLRAVQTFGFEGRDGNSTSYLSRTKGFAETREAVGWSMTRYMKDEMEWDHRKGGALVFRKKGETTPNNKLIGNVAYLVAEMEATLSLGHVQAAREPASDVTTGGKEYAAYRLTEGEHLLPTGALVYIDAATGRVARLKIGKTDLNVTYDPTVPEGVFQIPGGPSAQVVEMREYLEKEYPLEGTVFKAEGTGLVFAVHSVTQVNGCFEVICSSRVAPSWRSATATIPDDRYLGGFSIWDMKRGGASHFHFVQLAQIRESGMQVNYVLMVPVGEVVAKNRCQFSVNLEAADPLVQAMGAGDVPAEVHNVRVPVDIEVSGEGNGGSAREFGERAYDAVAPLVGIASSTSIGGPSVGEGLSSRKECGDWVEQKVGKYLPEGMGGAVSRERDVASVVEGT